MITGAADEEGMYVIDDIHAVEHGDMLIEY